MAANDDTLELILTTRLKGAQDINAGVKAAQAFATAESKVVDAFKAGVGPYERRIRLQKELNAEMMRGNNVARLADLSIAARRNADQIRRLEQPGRAARTPGDDLAQAFFSTRFGGGTIGKLGLQPLVGRSLQAISPELKAGVGRFAKAFGDSAAGLEVEGAGAAEGLAAAAGAALSIVAPYALVATAGIAVAAGLYQLGAAGAALTQAFSDMQYQVGGAAIDAAQAQVVSRITGVDAGSASRSLRNRITSDPLAMGIAAQYGVRALPGIFGQRNYGAQYLQLVRALAANPNKDQALRQADQLGIGQEVQRMQLVSPETQGRLSSTAGQSASINSLETQRKAAEFQAAVSNVSQAYGNFVDAFSLLFNAESIGFLNGLAGFLNWYANQAIQYGIQNLGWKKSDFGPGASGTGANGAVGPNGAGNSVAQEQLAATMNLTAAMKENNRFLAGATDRDNEAIPVGLRGRNLANWQNNRLIHLGSLGAT